MFVAVLYEPFLVKVGARRPRNCCSKAAEIPVADGLQPAIITIIAWQFIVITGIVTAIGVKDAAVCVAGIDLPQRGSPSFHRRYCRAL